MDYREGRKTTGKWKGQKLQQHDWNMLMAERYMYRRPKKADKSILLSRMWEIHWESERTKVPVCFGEAII